MTKNLYIEKSRPSMFSGHNLFINIFVLEKELSISRGQRSDCLKKLYFVPKDNLIFLEILHSIYNFFFKYKDTSKFMNTTRV